VTDRSKPASADTGTDGELDQILNCAYACTRVWSAWEVGTMGEDDFQPAAETDIRDDLIAWRDAAVKRALEEAQHPAKAAPGLSEQVTSVLDGAGFIASPDAPGRSTFQVTEGVGVTLGKFWRNAPEEARSEQLATLAYLLETGGGIDVPKRGQFLFVPAPGAETP
jgi:hypothetical protein